jgi:translation initiation factor 1
MAKRRTGADGLVYSTDPERMNARSERRPTSTQQGDGRVRVRRETKGRQGKTVTTIQGLALDAEALAELGRELKQSCGAGGTVKDGVVELQGDRVARVLAILRARGIDAKQSGG